MADVNMNQNDTVVTDAQGEGNQDTNNDDNKPDVTIDSLMAEIAQLKADGAKNKAALDKALREKGEITKLYRAKQTAEEQEAEAKKEADEQAKAHTLELEQFQAKTLAKERYLMQGMDIETATSAAEAEITGDMDALATIQTKFREIAIKQAVAQELKARPPVQAGTGTTDEKEDPFLAGFNSVNNKF
jgi:hypothetical protein